MLTEEALEGGNKDLKNFELNHSMHTTPEQALKDVFHRLMRRSDPIIQAITSYSAHAKSFRAF